MSAPEHPGTPAAPAAEAPDETSAHTLADEAPAPTLADESTAPTPAARARRARIAAASLLMAAAAVVLALRLASRSSVLVVGVYGLLLILCGVVIELSRRGRTRLGSYLLAAGLAAALVMDGFVLS
ncbi:hypothetical protein AB0C93_16920 [Streptomyces sp. NPDC048518]|uniref:hypothetical protein n=1 Tax=Streptomyces sp. NPDC048518 TaxID=3155029 RepID=UPI00340D1330